MLSILDHQVAVDQLKEDIPVGRQGSSINDLKVAAEKHGAELEVVSVEKDQLKSLSTPFVVHFDLANEGGIGHFVTVLAHPENGDESYTIYEPNEKKVKKISQKVMSTYFSGFALVKSKSWGEIISQKVQYFVIGCSMYFTV